MHYEDATVNPGGFRRQLFDKAGAATYLSAGLNKEISEEAMRQLHYRGTCIADILEGRRRKWTRVRLDTYIQLHRAG